jgi:hypothetical protein
MKRACSSSQWLVETDAIFGCHLWVGKVDKDRYPVIWNHGGKKVQRAHRVAYREVFGELELGVELDHTCRRRACVNAFHLEPVSRDENEKRKRWAYRAKRAHCARGHSLYAALLTAEGGRVCRTCNQLSTAADMSSRGGSGG